MSSDIEKFNNNQSPIDEEICATLMTIIDEILSESECKIWHAHPVWFIAGNPIVGYSKQKAGIRLMFWSGADFEEQDLNVKGKKFKDASIFYQAASEIDREKLKTWLQKSKVVQWDYKNIVKRKGVLERLK